MRWRPGFWTLVSCFWCASGSGEAKESWCSGPPTSAEVLSSPQALNHTTSSKLMQEDGGVPFLIAMMGPRVGSKMLRSMLESYDGGEKVACGGEGTERHLEAAYPGADVSDKYRLSKYYRDPKLSLRLAVGYKTEKYLQYNRTLERYEVGPWYSERTMAALDVRVICLPRLNVVARIAAGQRKTSGYRENATLFCDDSLKVQGHYEKEARRIDAFYDKCQELGQTTRTLWVPRDARAEGALRRRAAFRARLRLGTRLRGTGLQSRRGPCDSSRSSSDCLGRGSTPSLRAASPRRPQTRTSRIPPSVTSPTAAASSPRVRPSTPRCCTTARGPTTRRRRSRRARARSAN